MGELLTMIGHYYFISAYQSFQKMAIETKVGDTIWLYESYQ